MRRRVFVLCVMLVLVSFTWSHFAAAEEGKTEKKQLLRLGEIVVTATRTRERVEDVPAAVEVITAEEMKRENIQNLDEALRHVPGVFARRGKGLTDTRAGVYLRGFSDSKRTLVLVDGQPLNIAYSGNVVWGGLPTENIERIEVVKGPFSSLYGGNAMGGVINIITRTPTKRSIRVTGGVGTEDTLMYGVNYDDRFFDRLSLSLGFKKQETNGYLADFYVKNKDATTSGTGTPVEGWGKTEDRYGYDAYLLGDEGRRWGNTRNCSAKLSFDLTPQHLLLLSVMEAVHEYGLADGESYLRDVSGDKVDSGKVEIDGKVYSIYPYYFQSGAGGKVTDIYNLQYKGELSDWLTLKASAGITEQEGWYTTPYSGKSGYGEKGGDLTETPSESWQYEIQTDITLGDKNLLTLGVSYKSDKAENAKWLLDDWKDERDKGKKIYEAKGKDRIYSAFVQDRHEFPWGITLYAGGRYDYWETYNGEMWDTKKGGQDYDKRDEGYFSPKLALHYKAAENLTFRTSAGYAFRWPSIYELYATRYSRSTEYRGNPYLDPETTKSWDMGVDCTLNKGWTLLRSTYFENYVEDLIYRATDPDNSKIRYWDNAGKATIKGVELGLEQHITVWLDAFANFTYTDSRITENDADPDSEGKQITYYPREMASLGLNFHWDRVRVSLSGDYWGKIYNKSDNSDTAKKVPGVLDPHFVVNSKLSYNIVEYAEFSLSVDNVLDEEYYMVDRAPGRSVLAELTLKF